MQRETPQRAVPLTQRRSCWRRRSNNDLAARDVRFTMRTVPSFLQNCLETLRHRSRRSSNRRKSFVGPQPTNSGEFAEKKNINYGTIVRRSPAAAHVRATTPRAGSVVMHPKVVKLVRLVARAFLNDVEALVMDKLTELPFIRVRGLARGCVVFSV